MRVVYFILLVYFTAAAGWLGYLIYGNTQEYKHQGGQLATAEQELAEANDTRQAATTELQRLETRLRRERLESSGEQAIQLSILVQAAQAELNMHVAACAELEEVHTRAKEKQQALRGKYLPLVLLLLLHIVGALVVLSFLRPKL